MGNLDNRDGTIDAIETPRDPTRTWKIPQIGIAANPPTQRKAEPKGKETIFTLVDDPEALQSSVHTHALSELNAAVRGADSGPSFEEDEVE